MRIANTITRGRMKYGNRKTMVDGIVFDSRHEAMRWLELKNMERAGLIRDVRRQVSFELIPRQIDSNGRVLERAVKYVADFVYYGHNGKMVVEDAKGMKTDAYRLKKKMMLYFKGIMIQEV